MQIYFDHPIKDVLGRDVEDGNLGWACAFALATAKQGLTGPQKFTRGVLAQRIMGSKESLDLTAEEVAEIKAAVGEVFASALVAPIWQALEGRPVK